ncbi:uncharacterized protein LACBIDRAFT_302161 [Laccaria bicolor S238N-H82]|uniref:Predicted protein n=1 Tax=Laccaria bicolor (strain S238N-H82 / ATCC MYA-4686) TaxID=486041 RepID=B0DH73_LACBS|nr:uncharacterized protein LACBIDRAFT_302161 [Laccaria bicolor S238N-H82]EDR05965.1 predicted protein [Laccaria bicolor S238N-H82]|eukprot:XP_001883253.1 predicted protein [Laccaria bicolor S238N-H82]
MAEPSDPWQDSQQEEWEEESPEPSPPSSPLGPPLITKLIKIDQKAALKARNIQRQHLRGFPREALLQYAEAHGEPNADYLDREELEDLLLHSNKFIPLLHNHKILVNDKTGARWIVEREEGDDGQEEHEAVSDPEEEVDKYSVKHINSFHVAPLLPVEDRYSPSPSLPGPSRRSQAPEPATPTKQKLEFVFPPQGRRIQGTADEREPLPHRWLYEMLGDLKKGRNSLLDVLKRAREEVNEAAGELLRVQALVSKEHARSLKAHKELEQIIGPFKASQLKGKVDKAMEKMEWPSDETDSSDDPDIVARHEIDAIKKKKEEARKKKKTDLKRKRDHKDRSLPPNGKGREGDDEGRRYDDGDSPDEDKDQRPKPSKRARRNGQDQNGTSAHPEASTAKLLEARDPSIPFIGPSQKRPREDEEDSATSEGEVERSVRLDSPSSSSEASESKRARLEEGGGDKGRSGEFKYSFGRPHLL